MNPGPQWRRTKIIATVGPASSDQETLREMIDAGVDVFRINFSHGTADEHAVRVGTIRAAAAEAGREVGILGDLPGPKLRLAKLEDDVAVLHSASQVTLTGHASAGLGTAERLKVHWEGFAHACSVGDTIFLADGRVRLRVLRIEGADVVCEIEAGGAVSSHQGVNLPGADAELPDTGRQDEEWVEFAIEHELDLLAVSFVRRPSDLEKIDWKLAESGADIPLIAKIEKPQAAERAEEIIAAAESGIMVARGDLGVELPVEDVPGTQKHLIKLAGRASKPSITATQMLATMVKASRPTRAEATDVANAIYDGTDAVMLSEETAVGEHVVEVVRVMDRIARATEKHLPYDDWVFNRVDARDDDVAEAVAQVAVASAYRLKLAAIVVPTSSGRTARLVSAFRPRVPVLALSENLSTVRRMNLLFGTRSALAPADAPLRELLEECARIAVTHGVAKSGDLIAITAGLPQQRLGTNLFEIHRVP
ncbi:MAG: pyruvate kinase [Solirubrobacterales bacterium]|nr:pyruvate kinase [Solirubrobacterales bacterium]